MCLLSTLTLLIFSTARPQPASGISSGVVISQIYGGGGSSSTSFRSDFIELFNRGTTAVNLTGWSVQYAGALSNSWEKTDLSGSIAPGQYFLIQMAAGGGGSKDLPAPDAVGSIPLDATGGKVALVRNNTLLENTGNCPSASFAASIVDFVGYSGAASCFEGAASAPAASDTSAVVRRGDGCADTDSNKNDFVIAPPTPRNSASTLKPCAGVPAAKADLVITIQTASPSAAPQSAVKFTINISNTGPAAATNVIVTDSLSGAFAAISADGGGVISGSGVSWPAIQILNPGASRNFVVTATASSKAGRLVSRAMASSDVFDPNTANNVSLSEVNVIAGALFEKENVRVTINPPGLCNTTFTVETRIKNTGFTTQKNNPDPEFLAFLSPEITGVGGSCFATKGVCKVVNGSNAVRWDGEIAVGEEVTITYSAQIVGASAVPSVGFCVESSVNFDSDNDGANDTKTTTTDCDSYACVVNEPTEPMIPPSSMVSDQKAGSILIFNLYCSDASKPAVENTRINITNVNRDEPVILHAFFIAGGSCEVSDTYLCLTPTQTTSFLTSDIDPGVTGYLIVVATNDIGCPVNFNYLIGDEYVKLNSGHAANLGAEAFAAIAEFPCVCDENSTAAEIAFDGERYNQAPRALSVSNIPSPGDNNSTVLVVNRVGGDLSDRAEAIGEFNGLLFDDLERGFSFSDRAGCQFKQKLSSNFPRTTPRFSQIIPSGHAGWMKIAATNGGGIIGAVFVFNSNTGVNSSAYRGGRNMHIVTLTSAAKIRVPVFPTKC